MNRNPVYILMMILPFCIMACTSKPTLEGLKDNIGDTLSQQGGTFAVAFRDLTTGETLLINEAEVFHAASTMKTPVMIEVYKQAAEGKLSLNDPVEIRNAFKSIADSSVYSLQPADDSEQGLYEQVGHKRKLGDLLYDMIIVSSNLATNLIIERVGPKNVTQTMHDLGATDVTVLRGVEDQRAFERGLVNTTTAYGLLVLFEKIARGQAVNPGASKDMTRILLDQKFNEIIPAQLPAEVKVAHKTGSITGVRHDCGIIILPDGRQYVLVLLSKGLKDEEAGIKAMAAVSGMIYTYVTR